MSDSITKAKPVVVETNEVKEWFETWFDSPYYHILYKDRDDKEAELFLDKLIAFLSPVPDSRILDVACGKGRHSIYLNKKGYKVTGYDLSEESISYDKQFENDRLEFYLHDGCFISALNFSVFDYFNCSKIVSNGEVTLDKTVDGINFQIKKTFAGNTVHKNIDFNDKGIQYHFEERLMLFSKTDLVRFFDIAGLQIINTFGNYDLVPFDHDNSDRLILIAKKKSR